MMDKFVMKKSTEANIYKSIRFPSEINDKINELVSKANEGKSKFVPYITQISSVTFSYFLKLWLFAFDMCFILNRIITKRSRNSY